jgi:hypothetical protein
MARRARRTGGSQHLPLASVLLQPGGDVGGVPRHDEVTAGRIDARHHLARRDAQPDGQPVPKRRIRAQAVAQRQSGRDGPGRVVLVRLRHPEDGHHGIADELLDRAATRRHHVARHREEAREQRAHLLRIGDLREPAGSRDVREQHGHEASLLAQARMVHRDDFGGACRTDLPEDLPAVNATLIEEFGEGAHERTPAGRPATAR